MRRRIQSEDSGEAVEYIGAHIGGGRERGWSSATCAALHPKASRATRMTPSALGIRGVCLGSCIKPAALAEHVVSRLVLEGRGVTLAVITRRAMLCRRPTKSHDQTTGRKSQSINSTMRLICSIFSPNSIQNSSINMIHTSTFGKLPRSGFDSVSGIYIHGIVLSSSSLKNRGTLFGCSSCFPQKQQLDVCSVLFLFRAVVLTERFSAFGIGSKRNLK